MDMNGLSSRHYASFFHSSTINTPFLAPPPLGSEMFRVHLDLIRERAAAAGSSFQAD